MNRSQPTITVLGSHSALDVCLGAKQMGFDTLVIAQKGREKTYADYYFRKNGVGCVDECIVVDSFKELLDNPLQKKLEEKNAIFIPHRSFEVYLDFNYKAIEQKFKIPMFGNRYLLKIEERGARPNQYDLLKAAKIRTPHIFEDPKEIDRLCIVKILEKARGFERAFFLVESFNEYEREVKKRLVEGVFTKKQLQESVIEEYILGVQVNFNFFYSPLSKRLELLGTDTRRQTNAEGITKVPASLQKEVLTKIPLQYEEAGHIAVTVLESMLEHIFEMGKRFVKATQDLYSPGVIGPFALQSIIIPGPPKKDIIVVDVSPRVPGSPGIASTPYTSYLFGDPVSIGRRIAMEIKEAVKKNRLDSILT